MKINALARLSTVFVAALSLILAGLGANPVVAGDDATALEHWLNGMLEVGLKRRGEQLDQATERGTLGAQADHEMA
ncbi:MAG: hypothetical protein M3237_11705 [Actinomycetota bacterium]|nr:hypothetical protein [Actinomycetota bacterium]